jgi:hypothetical protein
MDDAERAEAHDARARRGSQLSLFPLTVLAATFAVPSLRACGRTDSALSYLSQSPPPGALFVVAPYLAAALLLLATAWALRSDDPPGVRLRWAAYTSASVLFVSDAAALVSLAMNRTHAWAVVACVVIGMAAGLVAFVRASRALGYWRWILLLVTNAAFATGHPVTLLFVSTWHDSPDDLLGGGYLYLAALAIEWAILGWTLSNAPRRPAS